MHFRQTHILAAARRVGIATIIANCTIVATPTVFGIARQTHAAPLAGFVSGTTADMTFLQENGHNVRLHRTWS